MVIAAESTLLNSFDIISAQYENRMNMSLAGGGMEKGGGQVIEWLKTSPSSTTQRMKQRPYHFLDLVKPARPQRHKFLLREMRISIPAVATQLGRICATGH
jgi:hypothetical protein